MFLIPENPPFRPQKVYIEPSALDYQTGQELYDLFKESGVPVQFTSSHNRITGLPRQSPDTAFREAKKILVVGVRQTKKLQTCRPSAHFQLPLATGCPGRCHYCYLHTNLGKRPYLRVYVNIEEILNMATRYIKQRLPGETVFEGAAVCDPLFAEPFTGIVSKTINYFSGQEKARFRFVTKLSAVNPFLELPHRGRTHIRFSLNHREITEKFEEGTSPLNTRLEAASRIIKAGYPAGFMIAPIFLEGNWEEDYANLFRQIKEHISPVLNKNTHNNDHTKNNNINNNNNYNNNEAGRNKLSFELITHRFTIRARNNIGAVFPGTPLMSCMHEEDRRFKYGQFGYGKYLYPKENFEKARLFFENLVSDHFPDATVDYFI